MRLVDEETLARSSSNASSSSKKNTSSRIPVPVARANANGGKSNKSGPSPPGEPRRERRRPPQEGPPQEGPPQEGRASGNDYDDLERADLEAEEARRFARNKSKSVRNKSQFLPSNLLRPLPTIGPDGVGTPLNASTPMRPGQPRQPRRPRVGGAISKTRSTRMTGKIVVEEEPPPPPPDDNHRDDDDDDSRTADDEDNDEADRNDTLASEMSIGEDAMSYTRKRLERAASSSTGNSSRSRSKKATSNLPKSDEATKKAAAGSTPKDGTNEAVDRRKRRSAAKEKERRRDSAMERLDEDDEDRDPAAPAETGVDGLASKVGEATKTYSKRATSASFAVPDPPPSPSPLTKKKKKTTKTTTTTTIKTTTTKKKITTTQVVSEGRSANDDDDGPRRSRRNRTEVAGHCTAVYKWENGYKVKVGEVDMADDPKYAHMFVKGALTKKKKGLGKRGKRADEEEGRTGKPKKRRGIGKAVVDSDDDDDDDDYDDDEEGDAVDPADEWIEVLANDQTEEIVVKRLFRPTSSHEYVSVDRGAVNISFMKTFDQTNYSSGALILGPNGVKENQLVKNADMIFFCQKGVARVTIHDAEIVVKKGDTFCAPRFNKYSIANVSSNEEAKLVFFQAKFRDG